MPVSSLVVTHVGPFDEIALTFDEKVNVLTGPNNSGKSTLLWVLGELLVYPFTLPQKSLRSDEPAWEIRVSTDKGEMSAEGTLPTPPTSVLELLKHIGYTCYVPAQRLGTDYRSEGPLASGEQEPSLDDLLAEWYEERRLSRLTRPGQHRRVYIQRKSEDDHYDSELTKRAKSISPGNLMVSDDAVKQRIIDLDYAAHRRDKPSIKSTLNDLASLASAITQGFPLTFEGVAEDINGLYPEFGTPEGPLPLEVLSQGTQSIVNFLARFLLGYAEYYDFPENLPEKPGVLIVDEIDAHLHPSWQRRIIPALTENFPRLQIFCSTHSPLMLAGLEPGQVQLLRRGKDGAIDVSTNGQSIAGWTADEILQNLMDIANPTDERMSAKLARLDELLEKAQLSVEEKDELMELRKSVRYDILHSPTSTKVQELVTEIAKATGRTGGSS